MSSQITVSTKSNPYNMKTAPYPLPNEEIQTNRNIYDTHAGPEILYDDLENVRKQTLAMAEDNIYGNGQNALYSARDQYLYTTSEQNAGPHEEPFNHVQDSNVQDPLYQFQVSQTQEDPYSLNRVNNTQDINAVRDQFEEPTQNYIQGPAGITNPELDNVFIYTHLSG